MITKLHSMFLPLCMVILMASSNAYANTLSGSDRDAPDVGRNSTLMAAPVPPICDKATTVLHWDGGKWDCVTPPKSAPAGAAPGSMIGICSTSGSVTQAGPVQQRTTTTSCSGVLMPASCVISSGFQGFKNTCSSAPKPASLCSASNGKMSGEACYAK